ncbi:MAG: hypothetical protein JSW61_01395, partial [Candidatus Thorarchaeota archaeon]
MNHVGLRAGTVCVLLILVVQLGSLSTVGNINPMTQNSEDQTQEGQNPSIDLVDPIMQNLELENYAEPDSAVGSLNPVQTMGLALESQAYTWTTGGDADWYIDTTIFSVGDSSVRSGDIGHNEQSWIETTISGPAIVSFDWKISSERNFDF